MTGNPLDPVLGKVAEALAKVVIQSAWNQSGKLFGWMGGRLNEGTRKLIYSASQQYAQNYQERHGTLKVLGMQEPVQIESIYTEVQFLGKEAIRQYASLEEIEKAYAKRSSERRFQAEDRKKQSGIKVANQKQFLMVLGQPGSGKTTFLRRMGWEALKGRAGRYQYACMPIFIELKEFNTSDIDLKKTIIDELATCKYPEPQRSAEQLLDQGKLLLLLDGLDEVNTNSEALAIQRIQKFVDRYNQNRFICSCRTAAYQSRFRRFSDVVMADFDDNQIRQYITNWFSSKTDKVAKMAYKCWKLLNQADYKAAKELAQTPLLLTFLCLVYDDSQSFPKNRAVLYGDALDILLKRWAAEKRVAHDSIYKDLTVALEEMMLAEIAYKGFHAKQLFFSRSEIMAQIREFLANNLNAPKHLDGDKVIDAIRIQQGILVERARSVLSAAGDGQR
ncbi:signal transduction protein [Anabaenopsis circularis NIES-21]|uniref:Signal transduction protein n=1 Tax=Anabaenopsis circularis NIES-21 TaxID=1085406 RepID=A0A1Z4GPE1_9CYAN|nr:signal transduction protein [Anabaenopsis circularis NIES-21]